MYSELKTQMQITNDSILVFPTGQTKIHIFAYKNYFPQDWGGRAYFGGLMIYSLDHPQRTAEGHTEITVYTAVVKHELMHVIQYQLIGRLDYSLMQSWFAEGIAEKISESNPQRAVTSLQRLDELTSTYGELNPVAIKTYNYPDIDLIEVNYYYPMFQLAANYLLDPAGGNGTWVDVKNIFLDIRNGGTFLNSFENHFGFTVTEFENNFFELIRNYLN
jgi:hypothetical protein